MVIVDDATYAKMKDTLYGGNAGEASKAKARIESSYTDEQYNKFVNQLGGVKQQPTAPADIQTPTPPQTTPEIKQETEIKQQETVGNTVPEIKQEGVLKPLSQEYYNQTSDEAQSKIISNLNNYRQTNPEYFRDYESFKKNFSYDARNDEQKQTLDSWYGGYQKGMELAGVPVTDLYTQYKDGQVSMNELENLRVYDPNKYAELQNQINKGNIIAAYDDDKGQDTAGKSIQDMAYDMAVQTFTKFMNEDGASEATQFFRDYEAKMKEPEMLALSDQCTEVQEQMENVQSDLDSIKKQVEAEYEGTGATRSKINAIIADRSYDLQLQLRTLNSEYNKYATQYNNRMQQYQNEFSMQLQEYQLNQQARNQQMQELGFAMDLMNFETNEQKAQREWDYWVKQQEYTNGNINSSDYQTRYKAALKSVQNLLSQYEGIPMKRSAEQMADDILKAIDGGSDLGAELTKINQQIQGKKEYKMLYNQTYRNPDAGITGSYTIGDQQYVVYNGKLMSADSFNATYGSVNADGKASTYGGIEYTPVNSYTLQGELMDFANNHAVGTTGGWCGKFVNDYLQSIGLGRLYGDSVSSKTKTINTDKNDLEGLSIGSVAVFDYSHSKGVGENAKNYGHVAIVSDIDTVNGRVKLLESNYNGDKKVTNSRWVNVGKSGALKGYFDPSKGSVSVEKAESNSYTENRVPLYEKYWENKTLPSDSVIKSLGNGDYQKGLEIFSAEAQAYKDKIGGQNKEIDPNKSAFVAAGNNIALNLGSVSATSQFNDQLQKYLDNGDYTNAFEYITTQARNKADSSTRDAINSAESAISALVSIQQGLDSFYKKGGDTGIFAGTAEQVANRIGETTDPELKQLATQINVAIQKYRQAISGAAFSEQEAAEYAAIFPSTKNSKKLNTALIDGTLETMLQNLTSSYAQILGTSTYTDLLQAYQDSTGNIYDYYGGKNNLTKYLKNNGYINRGGKGSETITQTTDSDTTRKRYSTLPQTSTLVRTTTANVGGFNVPTNFYQK